MNSKLLVSIVVIGLIAIAIGGAMTGAFFSDTETSEDNTFEAGSIDLKIDSTCHYNGNVCNENGLWEGNSLYPVPGTSCDCTWLAKDLDGNPIINFADIKPGDNGESTISIDVTSNPAWVCVNISSLTNADNGCNEPELEAEGATPTCDNPGVGQGELQDVITFDIWRDFDCGNDFDGDDKYLQQGVTFSDLAWAIADSQTGTAVQPGEKYCIAIGWSVPSETGNIIQSDSLSANINFYAVQERHNPNFVCVPVQEVCGNGVKEGTEQCDDGNLINGDGCSSTCEIEVPVCGNGVKEGTEQCDDGNNNNSDSCLNTCKAATCGDGFVETGVEQCDDGNNVDGDGCQADCTLPLCVAKPDLMLVLDRSGSINTTEMDTLKNASHSFVTALNPQPDGAHMGQTSFETTGRLDLHLTGNKTAIDKAINDTTTSLGNTNLYEGLFYANLELNGSYDRNGVESPDYMVVITDGEPNEPGTLTNARNKAEAEANRSDAAGTKIYVVGVGVTTANAQWLAYNISTSPAYYFNATKFTDLDNILKGIANCD